MTSKETEQQTVEEERVETVEEETGTVEDAAAEETDPMALLQAELEEAKAQKNEANDRFLRANAELENFKKRTARETAEFRKYANEAIVKQLLPVLDNLERAIGSAADGEASGIVDGVRMTLSEIDKIFGNFHVTPVEAEGQTFDPAFHMAVAQVETADVPPNSIVEVFQKGYLMHDRLIRPAMVSVSKPRSGQES